MLKTSRGVWMLTVGTRVALDLDPGKTSLMLSLIQKENICEPT